MRAFSCRVVCAAIASVVIASAAGAAVHPVEARLARRFPGVSLDVATKSFSPTDDLTAGSHVAGLRAVTGGPLEVSYPRAYGDAVVVASPSQRVALRATGARPAIGVESAGKLVYEEPFDRTAAVELPGSAGSEELLLLDDERAPRAFEYEVVEMEGVTSVALEDGAVRFHSDAAPVATPPFSHPAPDLEIARPWIIDASGARFASRAKWTLTGGGRVPYRLRLTIDPAGLAYPIVVDPSFTIVGNLTIARAEHTATLLQNGLVLIAGGYNGSYLSSANLYDPSTGTYTITGSLNFARSGHTATLLPNGKVLIAGGTNASGSMGSLELYDPSTGSFTLLGAGLTNARSFHTATLLANGKVVLIDGTSASNTDLQNAEVFDPATNLVSGAGATPISARSNHTATLLSNGKVLIVGGLSSGTILNTAELYDPAGSFTLLPTMKAARDLHTATLLPSGSVLLAGGISTGGVYLTSAELYDPVANTFTLTGSMGAPRDLHSATLLPNGKVVVTGGSNSGGSVATAEVFDPAAGTNGAFGSSGIMAVARGSHTATLLSGGTVLVAGGSTVSSTIFTSWSELFDPTTPSFAATAALTTPRDHAAASLLPNGNVLISGGLSNGVRQSSVEIYNPAGSGTMSAPATGMTTPRAFHTASLLTNGLVLLAGGDNSQKASELYDPSAGTFTATPPSPTDHSASSAAILPNGQVLMTTADISPTIDIYDPVSNTYTFANNVNSSSDATATLLPNGKVLITGGFAYGAPVATAAIFDPATGTSTATGSMHVARYLHCATLLPGGKVLITGGNGTTNAAVATAEIFDPVAGAFNLTGTMNAARLNHTATLLASGKVLITGGRTSVSSTSALNSAEIFDPATGQFTPIANLGSARYAHTATLLLTGKVFISGGTNAGTSIAASELFDSGDAFAPSRQPAILSAPPSVTLVRSGTGMTIGGSGFRAGSGASSSGTQSSDTNYPILQLQRVDSDQVIRLLPGNNWSDTSFTSQIFYAGVPMGYYRLSIITDGIASQQQLVPMTFLLPTISNISPSSGPSGGGTAVTITGTNFDPASTVTFGGLPAFGFVQSSTSIIMQPPREAPGAVPVVVTTSDGATARTSYTYVFSPPGALGAQPNSATTMLVEWSSVPGAAYYEVDRRSAGNSSFVPIATISGLSMLDSVSANSSYLYEVRSIASNGTATSFTPPVLATTVSYSSGYPVITAANLNELRTAVSAVRALAGLQPFAFTNTIAPGVIVHAVDLGELRTAIDAARSSLLLPAISYTTPAPVPGAIIMGADYIMVKSGTQDPTPLSVGN